MSRSFFSSCDGLPGPSRRQFLTLPALAGLLGIAAKSASAPVKIAHRQANMMKQAGPQVFEFARGIPGLSGVELQVQFMGQCLWDAELQSSYMKEAKRTGLAIPSLAGIWPKGVSLVQTGPAEECIRKSIRAAEAMGAKVILAAAFGKSCPSMDEESAYGPVVSMLRKVAPEAANAGVTVGMETSLNAADQKKLIDLVNRKSVQIYSDPFNTETEHHGGQGVASISLLGKAHICAFHLKNGERLLEEDGPVDWAAALKALKKTGYNGWYTFETSHTSPEQCVESTKKNIALIQKYSA